MRIFVLFALGLYCGALVSCFPQGGLLLNLKKPSTRISFRSCTRTSGKSAITARFQTESVDRRHFLNGIVFSVAIAFNKKALAAESEDKFAAALLELSNQAPYEDKAVAFLSDGSPSFALAKAAFAKLGGTVVSIDPRKPVSEIQELYMKGNCIGAFVKDEKVVKNIMQGRGCECERFIKKRSRYCVALAIVHLIPAVVMPKIAREVAGVASVAPRLGRAGLSSSARRARQESRSRYVSPRMLSSHLPNFFRCIFFAVALFCTRLYLQFGFKGG